MLEIRPNCECCDKDLTPNSTEAMICSYECTFCTTCVDELLENVCPNCAGGFVKRPIRPKEARRNGVSINHQAPSHQHVKTKYNIDDIKEFSEKYKHIKPENR